jgi:hypothetical protein
LNWSTNESVVKTIFSQKLHYAAVNSFGTWALSNFRTIQSEMMNKKEICMVAGLLVQVISCSFVFRRRHEKRDFHIIFRTVGVVDVFQE